MAQLLEIALSNLIVASLLALPAALAGLWGKRPALTHALWLLVLLKLITPPLFLVPIDWPAPLTAEPEPMALHAVKIEMELPNVIVLPEEEPWIPPMEDEGMPLPDVVVVEPIVNPALPEAEPIIAATPWPWLEIVATVWLIGSALWLAIALVRLMRFGRMLRHAQPASLELRSLAEPLAAAMGIRCPDVCVVTSKISPMLWALWGAPRLVLPAELIGRLPSDQLAALLVHELAHWRRRDDRTRWLEIIVFALYWWCPLVWWARRELHQAEEECCDAWVVSQLPESAKAYALALVETVDFLSDAPTSLPMAASGLGHVRLLKRRLTMILNGKTPRALTLSGLLGVAGVGVLLLPIVPGWAQQPRAGGDNDERQEREEKRGERDKGPSGTPGGDLQKLRAEIQRLHAEMEQRKAEMDERANQIRMMMDQLQRMEKANQGGPNPMRPMDGDVKKKKGGFGGGNNPFPGGPGGGPGKKGGGFGGGGFGGGGFGGGAQSPIDQRLNDVERKLDQVLQEIRSMRNETKSKPGGERRDPPKGNANPNPNRGGGTTPLVPPGGLVAPVGPTPPVPPARQRNENEQ